MHQHSPKSGNRRILELFGFELPDIPDFIQNGLKLFRRGFVNLKTFGIFWDTNILEKLLLGLKKTIFNLDYFKGCVKDS